MSISAYTEVARRASLPLALLALVPTSPTSTAAQIPQGSVTIELETVASGLTSPVHLTHAGDGSGRLFIADQAGQVRIVEDGALLPTPFLDISDRIVDLHPGFDERGLLGLAFHPDYESNGRFFVRYSAPREGSADEPCFDTDRGCHTEVLSEFQVFADDANVADPDSERVLFEVDEPQFNHNAGAVEFGPDGYLYFSLGDGGGAHDGLADDPPSHGPIGNGQNIETALGSMLRIDVDGELPYAIPPDNPFVGADGLDEIYAYGFRNPFRFSFDDGPGGDGALFLGDVGQNLFEELDVVVKGGNYGWVIKEGFHCFDPFNPDVPPDDCPDVGPSGEPLIDPIVEYPQAVGGLSVIGGYVYRGTSSPILQGHYVFGDFSTAFAQPEGNLYYLIEPSPGSFEMRRFRIGLEDRPFGLFLKGIGEDEAGEVYACGSTVLAPTGSTGVVQRIVAIAERFCATSPNSVGDGALIDGEGSVSVSENDFTLAATATPPNEPALFIYGPSAAQLPFGDGTLCVSPLEPGIVRLLPPSKTDGAGAISRTVDIPSTSGVGQIVAGSTMHFQLWYRDPTGPGGTGFNLSDGLRTTFLP